MAQPPQATKASAPSQASAAAPKQAPGTVKAAPAGAKAGPTDAHHAWVAKHFGHDMRKLGPLVQPAAQVMQAPPLAKAPAPPGAKAVPTPPPVHPTPTASPKPAPGAGAPSASTTTGIGRGATGGARHDDPYSWDKIGVGKAINTVVRTVIKHNVLGQQGKDPWDTTNLFMPKKIEAPPGYEAPSLATRFTKRGQEGMARLRAGREGLSVKQAHARVEEFGPKVQQALAEARPAERAAHVAGKARIAAEDAALSASHKAAEAEAKVAAAKEAHAAAETAAAAHKAEEVAAASAKNPQSASAAAKAAQASAKAENLVKQAAVDLQQQEAKLARLTTAAHDAKAAVGPATEAHAAALADAAVKSKALETAEATLKDAEGIAAKSKVLDAAKAALKDAKGIGAKFKVLGANATLENAKEFATAARAPAIAYEGGVASAKFAGPLSGAISGGLALAGDVNQVRLGKMTKSHAAADVAVQTGVGAATGAAAAWAGAEAGAAIGTMVGGPVGTVAGGLIGAGVGLVANVGLTYAADHTVVDPMTRGLEGAVHTTADWFRHRGKPKP